MGTLKAGFGRADITPKLGCAMVGYGNRPSGATGVHDPLQARALVLESDAGCWGIVVNDLCYTSSDTVAAIRAAVERRTGIPAAHLLVANTHTHAGPHDGHVDNWPRPLAELVADAVEMAYNARQPARMGSGTGVLYGYSINRRWLDRPIDPGIAILRVDDLDGNLLGLFTNFACHSVVMGYDNTLISGDWPGDAMRRLEERFPGATCLFTQGGSGNINPLVAGVRKRLRGGQTIRAIGNVSAYYGKADDPNQWSIGDRGGGTFEEVAELGAAFADEVAYTAGRIQTTATPSAFWSEQVTVNAAADPGEHPERATPFLITERPDIKDPHNIPAEIMLLRLGDMLLVTQPAEVFAETAINLKIHLRALGYATPALVTYANGFLLYLPEPGDFPEGGYEVQWAVSLGLSSQFQPRFRAEIEPVLQRRG
ncbi:MAG: neutral/alkaline non-lysosomal ceramidase N-terminal domain-containing protein [Caldilineaceae bacterium]|nr:neutral/alkaline non-lysosomal ceramidase N-terminal domain-containing protein [Caldilineaceae bacterium]